MGAVGQANSQQAGGRCEVTTAAWTRVYICYDPIAAHAVVGMLEAEGIAARVRDLTVSPYPVTIGPLSERHVEVPGEEEERAIAVLDEARQDGVLDPE